MSELLSSPNFWGVIISGMTAVIAACTVEKESSKGVSLYLKLPRNKVRILVVILCLAATTFSALQLREDKNEKALDDRWKGNIEKLTKDVPDQVNEEIKKLAASAEEQIGELNDDISKKVEGLASEAVENIKHSSSKVLTGLDAATEQLKTEIISSKKMQEAFHREMSASLDAVYRQLGSYEEGLKVEEYRLTVSAVAFSHGCRRDYTTNKPKKLYGVIQINGTKIWDISVLDAQTVSTKPVFNYNEKRGITIWKKRDEVKEVSVSLNVKDYRPSKIPLHDAAVFTALIEKDEYFLVTHGLGSKIVESDRQAGCNVNIEYDFKKVVRT